MDYATLAQGTNVLKMISDKKLSVRHLQELMASGLLSDVLDAEDCNGVNRNDLRASLGLKPVQIFPTHLHRHDSFWPLLEKVGDFIVCCANDDQFGFTIAADELVYVEVVNFGRVMSYPDALKYGRMQGLRELTHAQSICCMVEHWDVPNCLPRYTAFAHKPVRDRILTFERNPPGQACIGTGNAQTTGNYPCWAFMRTEESYERLRRQLRIAIESN